MRRWALLPALFAAVAACGPPPDPPARAPGAEGAAMERPGATRAGTLRTDQITVELWDGPVLVRLTPLDEQVIQLTAPDTHRRLQSLAEEQRRQMEADTGRPDGASLFLVSFQSRDADRTFDPGALALEVAGQRRWPLRITAVSPGWGQQRLQPRTAEVAVYAFPGPVPLFQPFSVVYGTRASDAWRGVIPVLEAERARN